MSSSFSLSHHFQNWQALPSKALYWVEANALFLSDLHLGRTAHLRKHGFALHEKAHEQDFIQLQDLVLGKAYTTIYILGDLFHSKTLSDSDFLSQIIKISKANWILVKGNHDVFADETYFSMGFYQVVEELTVAETVLLKHEPSKADLKSFFCISGHLHPGYQLKGKARQSIVLPCFYFTQNQIILPAFGVLTGLHKVKKTGKATSIVVCSNLGVHLV